MKEIKLSVFNKGEENSDTQIVESSYRVINIDRFLNATKVAIISLIEKMEDQKIEWLPERIEALVNGDLTNDSFYINDHFYSFN